MEIQRLLYRFSIKHTRIYTIEEEEVGDRVRVQQEHKLLVYISYTMLRDANTMFWYDDDEDMHARTHKQSSCLNCAWSIILLWTYANECVYGVLIFTICMSAVAEANKNWTICMSVEHTVIHLMIHTQLTAQVKIIYILFYGEQMAKWIRRQFSLIHNNTFSMWLCYTTHPLDGLKYC